MEKHHVLWAGTKPYALTSMSPSRKSTLCPGLQQKHVACDGPGDGNRHASSVHMDGNARHSYLHGKATSKY